jgi:hypothetical protein
VTAAGILNSLPRRKQGRSPDAIMELIFPGEHRQRAATSAAEEALAAARPMDAATPA